MLSLHNTISMRNVTGVGDAGDASSRVQGKGDMYLNLAGPHSAKRLGVRRRKGPSETKLRPLVWSSLGGSSRGVCGQNAQLFTHGTLEGPACRVGAQLSGESVLPPAHCPPGHGTGVGRGGGVPGVGASGGSWWVKGIGSGPCPGGPWRSFQRFPNPLLRDCQGEGGGSWNGPQRGR